MRSIDFELFKVKEHSGEDKLIMDEFLKTNEKEFEKMFDRNNIKLNSNFYKIFDLNKNLIGYDIIIQHLEKKGRKYKNIFFDISSFPRSVFFPLIKYLYKEEITNNLFIIWTEKKGLRNEINVVNYTQLNKIPLFPRPPDNKDLPFFYLPVLGYDDRPILKIFEDNIFDLYEHKQFFPIITFPSEWPEEPDQIILKHIDFFTESITDQLKDIFDISNIIHVPSNNPFELFLKVKNFKENKNKIYKDFIITLSPFGTKAQSLGVCLTSVLLNDLPIVYYNPELYKLSEKEKNKNIDYSEVVGKTYIALIKGDIYL